MENMIKTIKISKLFGDKDIEWRLQKTNVLVGKNGMGKSTILQLIIGAISKTNSFNKSELCHLIDVFLENDNIFRMTKDAFPQDLKQKLVDTFKNNPEIINHLLDEKINDLTIEQMLEKISNKNSLAKVTQFMTLKPIDRIHTETAAENKDSKIDFEFIATVNLNANSTQNVSLGNGETQNILDLEIQTELQRLLSINDKALNKKLITALNIMFSESEKKVRLNTDFELEFLINDETLYFPQLSSGERQVIYILLKVAIATKTNALILMDEPEISLHLSWQEKLLTQIREINPNSQIIIVTHSPAIVMNGWLDCFVDIQDIIVKG